MTLSAKKLNTPLLTDIHALPNGHGQNERFQARQAGYTLVELLVVLAILALLVSIATPIVLSYLRSSKASVAEIQVENLDSALDLFEIDMGRYPTQQEGLQALTVTPAGDPDWHGPYLKENRSLEDPWGRPYNYRIPGLHHAYDLWSSGPQNNPTDPNPAASNW